MTVFLMLLYVIYCLRTVPVSTKRIRQYTHLLVCPLYLGQVSHLLDILIVVVLKHPEEPHDQPRCNDHQHLKVHIRVVVFVGYAVPEECALCAVFIPPHPPLAFLLPTLQSTLLMSESRAHHFLPTACCLDCNHLLYLADAYFIDDGHYEVA